MHRTLLTNINKCSNVLEIQHTQTPNIFASSFVFCACVYVHVCMNMCGFVCRYVCMCVRVCMYVYVFVCLCVCVYVYVRGSGRRANSVYYDCIENGLIGYRLAFVRTRHCAREQTSCTRTRKNTLLVCPRIKSGLGVLAAMRAGVRACVVL